MTGQVPSLSRASTDRQEGGGRRWRLPLMVLAASAMVLTGCATSKDQLLPHGDQDMQALWQQGLQGEHGMASSAIGPDAIDRARGALRRPIGQRDMVAQQQGYTRDAVDEIDSQFTRLPNPDLVMFVYPHLAGDEAVPIPGYTTVFPLYTRPHYAMPGETGRPR